MHNRERERNKTSTWVPLNICLCHLPSSQLRYLVFWQVKIIFLTTFYVNSLSGKLPHGSLTSKYMYFYPVEFSVNVCPPSLSKWAETAGCIILAAYCKCVFSLQYGQAVCVFITVWTGRVCFHYSMDRPCVFSLQYGQAVCVFITVWTGRVCFHYSMDRRAGAGGRWATRAVCVGNLLMTSRVLLAVWWPPSLIHTVSGEPHTYTLLVETLSNTHH